MQGLMMDYPLTLSTIFRRAETSFPRAARSSGASPTSRSTATPSPTSPSRPSASPVALLDLGLEPGDRVATLGWNHGPHLEAYFGIPLGGSLTPSTSASTPTSSPTSSTTPRTARSSWTKACCRSGNSCRPQSTSEHVIVVGDADAGRRDRLRGADRRRRADARTLPDPDERTRRRDVLHDRDDGQAEGRALLAPRARAPHARRRRSLPRMGTRSDTVLPVVPMFHANAWGMPFTARWSAPRW